MFTALWYFLMASFERKRVGGYQLNETTINHLPVAKRKSTLANLNRSCCKITHLFLKTVQVLSLSNAVLVG